MPSLTLTVERCHDKPGCGFSRQGASDYFEPEWVGVDFDPDCFDAGAVNESFHTQLLSLKR